MTTMPSSLLPSKPFIGKTSVHGHSLKFPNLSKFQNSRKLNIFHVKATASARGAIGVAKVSSQALEVSVKEVDAKDENIAFVAGATGKVGSRTVRELLKLGFRVRAGVRSAQRAGSLVQSVKQMKTDVEGAQPVEKLEIVECDLENPSQIGAALGHASVVLCCIGASEKEVFDITGPYRIDYMATKNLVDAATAAKVKHFIMVSSLGTNKFGFPAAVLNLFWGVLCWKRKAEEALEASGVPYTIVRPGGMERPTDAYKETHNITLSKEDTLFGGQVSNLQVAELIAFMAQNRSLSYCKVVEVVAETTAPLTPLDKLLARIPSKRIEPRIEPKKQISQEPTADPPKNVVLEPTIPPPKEKEPEQPKVTDTRPLSPYSAYEDLKPPTSPTPTQSSGKKEDIKAAPADVVPEPSPVEAKIERPLSPYAMYEDLKPPASPTPTPPSGKKGDAEHIEEILFTFDSEAPAPAPAPAPADVVPEPSPVEAKIERPLSPYAMYEDLKPPTSPTPTPPSGKKEETEHIVEILFTFDSEAPAPAPAQAPASAPAPAEAKVESPLSPYTAYDDLKPPTSPTPSKPMVSPVLTSMNGGPATSSKDEPSSAPKIEQQLVEAKPTPLSPYTMYEDLKPPTTPTPSSP